MTTVIECHPPATPRPEGRQGQAAGGVVVGRLRDHRHDAAARRRAAGRGDGPAPGPARARRRRRQRQRDARRRPALVRGHVHRLRRALLARGRSGPRRKGCGSTSGSPTPRSCRSPTARSMRWCRLSAACSAPIRAHRRRARAGVPARRPDRARQLDARGLHRPDVQDHRQAPAAAGGREVAGELGHGASSRVSFGRAASRRAEPRHFVFRYRSAAALPRRLPHLLRTDAQGVRGARCARRQSARSRYHRSSRTRTICPETRPWSFRASTWK